MVLSLSQIEQQIPDCGNCPDLRDYCAEVGRTKRRAYLNEKYWAKPVPGFGDPHASIWIIGLAPGPHGANRTGRMFTGDRSGDFLYAALHRAGLASQPESVSRSDGLKLTGVYISAAIRCAPPKNKPSTDQLRACQPFLLDEWNSLQSSVRSILALGGIAWKTALNFALDLNWSIPKPAPKFGHGSEVKLGPIHLIGSYHVSQQNTFTGRLTEKMLDEIVNRAKSN